LWKKGKNITSILLNEMLGGNGIFLKGTGNNLPKMKTTSTTAAINVELFLMV